MAKHAIGRGPRPRIIDTSNDKTGFDHAPAPQPSRPKDIKLQLKPITSHTKLPSLDLPLDLSNNTNAPTEQAVYKNGACQDRASVAITKNQADQLLDRLCGTPKNATHPRNNLLVPQKLLILSIGDAVRDLQIKGCKEGQWINTGIIVKCSATKNTLL